MLLLCVVMMKSGEMDVMCVSLCTDAYSDCDHHSEKLRHPRLFFLSGAACELNIHRRQSD